MHKQFLKKYTAEEQRAYDMGYTAGKNSINIPFKFVPDTKPIHNEKIYDIIIEAVCTWFKIKQSELFSGMRCQYLVIPRSVAINLLRECTAFSFPQLSVLTGKDHTTLVYHVQMRLNKKNYWKLDNTHAIYNIIKELINEKSKKSKK